MNALRFSTLAEISATRDLIDVFGGYNHNIRIKDGEFFDMENLTSSYYPVLSPRDKRGIYSTYTDNTDNPTEHHFNGLADKDCLCYVDRNTLYIDNYPIAGLTLTDTPKQLISMGAYIIVMPDKKYINTKDFTDCGDIEATFVSTTSDTVNYSMCRLDGSDFEKIPQTCHCGNIYNSGHNYPDHRYIYACSSVAPYNPAL